MARKKKVDVIAEMVKPSMHIIEEKKVARVSDKYDADSVGALIAAAQRSKVEHGIVNVIELSKAYYIPIVDVRAILDEHDMM